jgi:hypothetical protein
MTACASEEAMSSTAITVVRDKGEIRIVIEKSLWRRVIWIEQ